MVSTWSCLREGIDVLVRRFPLLLGAWLVILAAQQAIDLAFPDLGPWLWLNLVLYVVLLAPLYAGQYLLAVQVVRGEPAAFRDLFRGFSQWGTIALVYLLTWLAVVAGFFLFVVPGIVWAITFAFAPIVVLDRSTGGGSRPRLGAVEAMRRSKELSAGYRGTLFGISLLLSLPTIVIVVAVGISAAWPEIRIPLWSIQLFSLLSGTLFLGPLHATSYMVAYDAITRLERGDQGAPPTVTSEERATGE